MVALAAVGLVCVAGPVYYLATGNRIGGAASAAELQRDWDDHQHAALGGDPSPFFRERGPVRVQAWEQWARANDPRGMVLYARCLQEGIGTTRDEPAAFSWYRRAAELDEPQAMVRLGDCYANGRGVAKDTGAALDWYRMAAKKTKETPRGR